MDPERTANIIIAPILFLLEYIFKFLAGVGSAIVIAAEGSFIEKTGAGFSSLWLAIRQLFRAPGHLQNIGTVIKDYNSLTAASFNQKYGGQAVNHVLEQLNHAVAYFQAIYQNLTEQPVVTVIATLITFGVLYMLGRTARFVRQRGQGSIFDRAERRIGKQVFDKPDQLASKADNKNNLKYKGDV